MKTPLKAWCSFLARSYYNKKYFFCKPNAKSFLAQLENAINNDLPISNIEMTCDKFKIDHSDFDKQYDENELKEIGDIYFRIVKKLETNKFTMKKERKIEIFNIWIYWAAGSDYDFLNFASLKNSTEFYSMRKLLEIVRSVLYEEKHLSCCFTYKRTNSDPDHLKILDSLYDDMMVQTDSLSRAICSQSLENVKLLIENGYVIENDENIILKSPLYWAFYCNNLEIFHYFIQSGYKINDNDIFYDPNFKKDFKFSIYLHFLKNNSKFNNIPIYQQLKFDYVGFVKKFKLYESLSKDQIFEMFESMFQIGFDLSIKTYILNRIDSSYPAIKQAGFEFTQLICCLCQNGITKSIIEYLVDKYLHEYGYERTQVELAKIIKNTFLYFHFYLNIMQNPRLKTTDLVVLLDNLLDLLNGNSLIRLRKYIHINNIFIVEENASGFIVKYIKNVMNQTEYHLNCLYDRKYFKIFDHLVKYKLINDRDIKDFLFCFLFHIFYIKYATRNKVHWLAMVVIYLLINRYFTKKKLFEWIRMLTKKKSFLDKDIKFIHRLFITVCDAYYKTPLKLTHIAREVIRDRVNNISKFDLKKLNLPEHLACFVRESILLNKKEYREKYGNKIKRIFNQEFQLIN